MDPLDSFEAWFSAFKLLFRHELGHSPGVVVRCQPIERRVRPTLIVVQSPSLDDLFCICQRSEPVVVEAFIAQRPVERFDEAVVGRFARTAEVDLALVMVGPQVQQMAGELAAIGPAPAWDLFGCAGTCGIALS